MRFPSPLSVRRRRVIRRELTVHLFSTLIWWAAFGALIGLSAVATGSDIPWLLIAQSLPLIAILEAVFFVGAVLRR